MRTRDKLAVALREVAAKANPTNAAKYEAFAVRAATGEFDDYADTYMCPITQLWIELKAAGFDKFAARVAAGEFDATKEESDEWARKLTSEMIERIISSNFRKSETARLIGMPLYKAVHGEPIPDGWELDYETLYYLPPNVKLL